MSRYFGVDYYPEHWPRERWEEDARLMEKMMYPESLPMDKSGVRQSFGGRHHCCHSNPALRRRIRLLVTAMAKHYGQCKDVTGWQIDNELGNSHDELCFCPSCTDAFQTWLTNKYGDIQTLNAAWGTAFWSQKYDDFSQISAPMLNVTAHNPSLLLDWRRFCSDLIVHFQHAQAEILRQHCPGQFLTHNMMGYADKVNYFHLARDLDFVSQDQYPYYQEDGKTFRNMENLSSPDGNASVPRRPPGNYICGPAIPLHMARIPSFGSGGAHVPSAQNNTGTVFFRTMAHRAADIRSCSAPSLI